MQQIRPLKIVQFVIDLFQQPVSGAELRNDAVRRALSPIADVSVVSPQLFNIGGKRLSYSKSTPTLLQPDYACIQNFIKYIKEERPDIILFEGVALLKFCKNLQIIGNSFYPKVILDSHNVESTLLEESTLGYAPALFRYVRSLWFGGKLTRVRKADAQAVHIFNKVLVPSQLDYVRLANLVGLYVAQTKIRIVNNIAPLWALDHLTPGEETAATDGGPVNRLLFVGHLRYRPNVEAVQDLLRNIWPRILSEFADMHLCVAGRRPKTRIKWWVALGKNVELFADPLTMAELYEVCDAVIIPLRSGGGSRIKVLEALAVGKPVIASAKAVEGLDLVDGENWLQAETPADYVTALSRLNDNPSLAGELVQNGKKLVRLRYGTGSLATALKSVLAELV